ncbi:major inositol transporter-like SP family MFS transporter [Pectinatus haikarae]|uniref:Major inositol transporter-like SP family MFS transporter n=1 Tax=Pectinatus haikarae TaxID=349096 RepID=A0ABT9Y8L4_9FIRM|nr:sugar porter family MFS transporter [Pectinatus haikarae]MDQ0204171.1 major inositol transporter-like SP family MFS transporter [Pectinatus haikarae]
MSKRVDPKKYVILIGLVATFGSLLFGYDTGVVNGALPFMARPDQLNLSPVLEGAITGAIGLGAALGCLIGGRLADLLGRRKNLLYLSILFFLATIGCSLSPNAYIMIAFRFILGVAVGASSVTVPIYLAEIATKETRGRMVGLMDLVVVSGQLLAFIINAVLAIQLGNTSHVWRYMIAVAAIPAVALFAGMLKTDESPRWLVAKGRISEAMSVLHKTRTTKEQVIAELNELQDLLSKEENRKNFTLSDLKTRWIRRLLFLGIGLSITQQITGVNSIMFYGSQILTSSGFSTQAALIGNIGNGVISVLGGLFGLYLVGKIGRRPMLTLGLAGTTVCMLGITLISHFAPHSSQLPFYVLGLTITFLAFQQSCVSPVTWLMCSEIFPLRMRATGTGMAVFFQWIGNFAVSFTFPILLNGLGLSLTFAVFVIMGLCAIIFVQLFMPETRGRTLEQLENDFKVD